MNGEVEDVVGSWGWKAKNLNGDIPVEVCVETDMYVHNTFIWHLCIKRFSCIRDDIEQRKVYN